MAPERGRKLAKWSLSLITKLLFVVGLVTVALGSWAGYRTGTEDAGDAIFFALYAGVPVALILLFTVIVRRRFSSRFVRALADLFALLMLGISIYAYCEILIWGSPGREMAHREGLLFLGFLHYVFLLLGAAFLVFARRILRQGRQ